MLKRAAILRSSTTVESSTILQCLAFQPLEKYGRPSYQYGTHFSTHYKQIFPIPPLNFTTGYSNTFPEEVFSFCYTLPLACSLSSFTTACLQSSSFACKGTTRQFMMALKQTIIHLWTDCLQVFQDGLRYKQAMRFYQASDSNSNRINRNSVIRDRHQCSVWR